MGEEPAALGRRLCGYPTRLPTGSGALRDEFDHHNKTVLDVILVRVRTRYPGDRGLPSETECGVGEGGVGLLARGGRGHRPVGEVIPLEDACHSANTCCHTMTPNSLP